jgi:hypothetical protein
MCVCVYMCVCVRICMYLRVIACVLMMCFRVFEGCACVEVTSGLRRDQLCRHVSGLFARESMHECAKELCALPS